MKTVILILFLFSYSFADSQTVYTSLENGSWGDNTAVWSLNGKDPCFCSPGVIVGNDQQVIIKHRISLVSNIRLVNGGTVDIDLNGFLVGSKYDMDIENGDFRNAGLASFSNMSLNTAGSLSSSGGQTFVAQNVSSNGRMVLKNAGFYLKNGIFSNATAGGMVELIDQSYLYLENGSIQNRGEMLIVSNSCLGAQNGSILNSSLGTMDGDARVIAGRNIENLGYFSPSLLWCSTGPSLGMTSPMSCDLTGESCFFAFLANDDIEARVIELPSGNEVSWRSDIIRGAEQWLLEKSDDGRNWEIVNKAGVFQQDQRIKFIDMAPFRESYYRLSALNSAEIIIGEWMLYLERKETASVYPVPFQERLNIEWTIQDNIRHIEFLSMDGRVLNEVFPEANQYKITLEPTIPDGFYWVRLSGNSTQFIKVVRF